MAWNHFLFQTARGRLAVSFRWQFEAASKERANSKEMMKKFKIDRVIGGTSIATGRSAPIFLHSDEGLRRFLSCSDKDSDDLVTGASSKDETVEAVKECAGMILDELKDEPDVVIVFFTGLTHFACWH